MLVFGALMMLATGTVGGALVWQNRGTIVHVEVGPVIWTGHLYAVFLIGVLLACWFMLGAAFVRCRMQERRERQPPRHVPARTTGVSGVRRIAAAARPAGHCRADR